jgi:hypothetical protein
VIRHLAHQLCLYASEAENGDIWMEDEVAAQLEWLRLLISHGQASLHVVCSEFVAIPSLSNVPLSALKVYQSLDIERTPLEAVLKVTTHKLPERLLEELVSLVLEMLQVCKELVLLFTNPSSHWLMIIILTAMTVAL